MRKRRDLLERERPRLEIIPMIDIMMFLLVFFVMIVLKMIPDSGVTLSLPGASTASSSRTPRWSSSSTSKARSTSKTRS